MKRRTPRRGDLAVFWSTDAAGDRHLWSCFVERIADGGVHFHVGKQHHVTPTREMHIIEDADLRAFATENFDRYQSSWDDSDRDPTEEDLQKAGIVEVRHEQFVIVNPYISECARFAVDPRENYGEAFDTWALQAAIAIVRAQA